MASTGYDTTSDWDITSEGTLLVNIGSYKIKKKVLDYKKKGPYVNKLVT
jgi:hypothetical protein